MSKDTGYSDSKADRQGSRVRSLEARIEELEAEVKDLRKWIDRIMQDTDFNQRGYID